MIKLGLILCSLNPTLAAFYWSWLTQTRDTPEAPLPCLVENIDSKNMELTEGIFDENFVITFQQFLGVSTLCPLLIASKKGHLGGGSLAF